MGKDLLNGEFKVFLGNQEISPVPAKITDLEYEIPSHKPLMAFDPAEEGGDKTSITQWKDGSIEMTFTIDNKDNPVGKWFWNMIRKFRSERKALLWALSHGYTIHVPCCDESENEGYIELTLPRHLRHVMRLVKFIPQYKIYDKYGDRFVIRKGKVVRMRCWPLSTKMLKEYMRKLKKYKV